MSTIPPHSPLPWHHFDHCEGHSINDARGHHVAYTDWDCDAFATEDAPADHNAAFIVRACNAHHDLLAALNYAYRILGALYDGETIDFGSALQPAADAIAKAETVI